MRRRSPELGSGGSTEVPHLGHPFVYLRGGRYLVVVNPRRNEASWPYEPAVGHQVEGQGVEITDGTVIARGFGYGIFRLDG
ncbi:hypothetical protein WB401_24795 [Streptomyces brasiliscabiei]|uniref:Uncharacterized protein n=1 Tax=Streptomyces brasiliscabiei TaxID=2736302 RepID=A0ABU8GD64_9ACTN